MVNVLLLGAAGVAGRAALTALTSEGHPVTVWDNQRLPVGVPVAGGPISVDLVGGFDAVVDLRPSCELPDRGVADLVSTCIAAGVPRLIRGSVTCGYADGGDGYVAADRTVRDAVGGLAWAMAVERQVADFTAAGGAGVVLRFGKSYGPDDVATWRMLNLARRGWCLLPGRAGAWHSAIHTADVGTAVEAALRARAGIWDVADSEPLRRADLVQVLASVVGRPTLRRPPRWLAAAAGASSMGRSHRVCSTEFRAETGWAPSVPSRRDGLPVVARQLSFPCADTSVRS
ncbi:hypothetical protein [Amycolatopsis nigrescens]|uniref:hypothetical protein n=1 Tax=Amycolatopsis nigrescens TaxID=381445 RepID=UPI00035C98D9|nr:hypothetical protein [Amycolatopsis nigrescens]